MKEKCPATCGKCDMKNANLCNDEEDSSVCDSMVVNSTKCYTFMLKLNFCVPFVVLVWMFLSFLLFYPSLFD